MCTSYLRSDGRLDLFSDDDGLYANPDFQEDWGSEEKDAASIDDKIADREIETARSTSSDAGPVSGTARIGSGEKKKQNKTPKRSCWRWRSRRARRTGECRRLGCSHERNKTRLRI